MESTDVYVGVDWSGARGNRLKSLRVAICGAGVRAPRLVPGPIKGDWSRPAFLEWLSEQRAPGKRVYCGLDFSFCFPYCDHGRYFPALKNLPKAARDFWSRVELVCSSDPDLFGGKLAEDERFRGLFRARGELGAQYERRLRVTENACQEQGFGTPETVFNLVGPKQVGKSSLAGMRFLHALKTAKKSVSIWPFDAVEQAGLIVLETFPTAFIRRSGQGPGKIRTVQRLNDVLTFYGSEGYREASDDPTDDEADALVTAAALRALIPDEALWNPRSLSDRVRRYEGWTFGVG